MLFSVQTSVVREKRPKISMRLKGGFGSLGHRLEEAKKLIGKFFGHQRLPPTG